MRVKDLIIKLLDFKPSAEILDLDIAYIGLDSEHAEYVYLHDPRPNKQGSLWEYMLENEDRIKDKY